MLQQGKGERTKNPQDWANYGKLLNQINNNVKTTIERNIKSSKSFTKENGSKLRRLQSK